MKSLSLMSLSVVVGWCLLLAGCNTDAPQKTTTTRTTTRNTTHVGSNIPQPDTGSTYTGSPDALGGANPGYGGGVVASHGGMR